ncbi:MAG: 5-oxoprolinase subunit PxpB [Oscillibacter sp.]|nr:5-oxoprolinase subunit PxpB [Oscillibacter sp.]MBQ2996525.1 5-oxoprolinase subunit PxpB [Oscillibacter sp.]
MADVRFLLTGDTSVTVEFGNEISTEINAKIRAFNIALQQSKIPGIVETVPTYRSLAVHYDPEVILYGALVKKLKGLLGQLDNIQIPPSDVLEIPVLYGGEEGPDIQFVAEHNGKTVQEVIDIHTSTEYLIYMLGFTPGFTYLGGMSEEIATPRLKTPRVLIPGGSVGIAGAQTGVYPIDSPGGWQLIGRTPVRMYDPDRATPILPEAGQYIKFYAIDKAEYDRIAALEAGEGYVCKRHPRKEAAE